MNRIARLRAVVPVVALSLALTACGDDEEDSTTAESTPSPSATAAAAEALEPGTWTGKFALVDVAPKGTKKIGGTATMVVSAKDTTASIAATGLDPKAVYVVHVHKDACSSEAGGTHFMFDPAGAAKPPNELWVSTVKVTGAKATGKGKVSKPVTSDAKSMVIHLQRAAGAKKDEAKPPKLACADLAPKKS
ncbi:MAG: hypothetical protein ACT4QF_15585 [Sporichthyaceae bacterium]